MINALNTTGQQAKRSKFETDIWRRIYTWHTLQMDQKTIDSWRYRSTAGRWNVDWSYGAWCGGALQRNQRLISADGVDAKWFWCRIMSDQLVSALSSWIARAQTGRVPGCSDCAHCASRRRRVILVKCGVRHCFSPPLISELILIRWRS